MTNKTTEEVRDAEIVNSNAELQAERREREVRAAKKIEEILISEGLALQPFVAYSEYGVIPRVRLVEHKPTTDEQGRSEDEAETTGDSDESTEPVTT